MPAREDPVTVPASIRLQLDVDNDLAWSCPVNLGFRWFGIHDTMVG